MNRTNKYKTAYNFIKKEVGTSPKMYSYPEADYMAKFIVMSSGDVYGTGYAEPFSTLKEMKEEESDSILQMFATEAIEPTEEGLEEFLEEYRGECECCNTSYKKEFEERVAQLEQENEKTNSKKN